MRTNERAIDIALEQLSVLSIEELSRLEEQIKKEKALLIGERIRRVKQAYADFLIACQEEEVAVDYEDSNLEISTLGIEDLSFYIDEIE